ncbi:MAG: XamI family restriction endonuclease [Propionibacteriaceae bacterium]|nr:XamI family restriction endonuclease [Propionibacteriaceae bacterium]
MINANRVDRWKADVAASVSMYNEWFFDAAPQAFKESRSVARQQVLDALNTTDMGRNLSHDVLRATPGIINVMRMMTAPPIARDRLVGLSGVQSRSLVQTLESGKVPPRMASATLDAELAKLCDVVARLLDTELMPWLPTYSDPTRQELHIAATVIGDRLCGAITDPIIRNAQEERQLRTIAAYLDSLGYQHISIPNGGFEAMWEGTYSFRSNVPVGGETRVNMPIDVVIQPKSPLPTELPILIECKSAGDYTNTNKRRKEEAQKVHQLRQTYGDGIQFVLFLCGYFDSGYLGYEAAEGIDWIWEHRIGDLKELGL